MLRLREVLIKPFVIRHSRSCYTSPMSTKQIASSTLWQMASQFVMAALSVITVKFIAIGLSKELAGNYNSSYAYLQIFAIISDFGLYVVSVKELAKAKDQPKVLGGLILIRGLISILSLGLGVGIAWVSPSWRSTPLPIAIAIAASVPLFTLLAGILRTVFQVTYKMHFVFISEVTQRIVTATLIGLVVVMGVRASTNVHDLNLFIAIGGLGAFVLFILSVIFSLRLMPVRFTWDSQLMKTLIKGSIPYGFAFLCVALYRQFDLTMIAILRPEDYDIQNAYYGFAGRITEMTYLVPTFLLNSTLPVLSKRSDEGADTSSLLGKTFLMILLLGSTSFLFCFLWSRPLIQLLTAESYLSGIDPATGMWHAGSDTALKIMSGPMLLNGIVLFSFYTMLTTHAWKPLVKTMLLGVVLSFSLNYFLIPKLGFVGAATTANVVNAVLAILLLPQALKIMPMRFPREFLSKFLIYTGVLALILWLFSPLLITISSIIVGLIAALGLMAVLAWQLKLHNLMKS